MKEMIKRMNRAIVRWIFYSAFVLARILPRKVFYAFVRMIMAPVCHHNSRLYRNSRRAVDTAYGDGMTPQEKEGLIQKTFRRLVFETAEAFDYVVNPRDFDGKVSIEGEQYLKGVLARGKGAVVMTAHFGNFLLMLYWFADRGYKVNVLMRPPRDSKINALLIKYFSSFGGKIIFTVPERECVQKSLKALRNNEPLFILIDQNYGADARIFVDFFGKKAATGASPVVFAGRTGAGIVPVFCLRKNGRNHMMVEPEIQLEGDPKGDLYLKENMQKMTSVVEDYVRRYPEQWFWMHDRWKSKMAVSDQKAMAQQQENSPVSV